MGAESRQRLIVALDYDGLGPAYDLARQVAESAGMFKVGSQLFTAEGPRAIQELAKLARGIFLDLKFHDIPNTVAGAVAAAAGFPGLVLMTLHSLGGTEMMRAAAKALRVKPRRPKLLAVTILTSMDAPSLRRVGLSGSPEGCVVRLARLAQQAGMDGVVASANEVRAIRRACGKRFLIVVPGVRPASAAAGDQARTSTPAEAIRAGADYVVVGRSITRAPDPRAAAANILEEIRQGLSHRATVKR